MTTTGVRTAFLIATVAALAACGSTVRQEAQWIEPSLGAQSRVLQGAKVLVACEVYDVALQRICEDQLSRDLVTKGAVPVAVPAGTLLRNDRPLDGQLVASATSLGARAVFVMTLTPATANWNPGVQLGIGGFSFGGSGGGGIGLSVPVGGGGGSTGFAANGRVTEASGGQLVWASTVVASPSPDLAAQVGVLSRSMLDAAQGAGLF